jgi:nitrile hydratase
MLRCVSARRSARPTDAEAKFRIGDAVWRARSTRRRTRGCRAIVRGRPGTIVRHPRRARVSRTRACSADEDPQWLYTVRFDAKALWGEDTTASAVHVDCWEPYLEAAP